MWAYSPELKTFCDGMIGQERAVVIPWPYDLAATQKLGSCRSPGALAGTKFWCRLPMSFHDIVQNHPFVLKSVLLDVWQELPVSAPRENHFSHFHLQLDRCREVRVVRIRQGIAVCAGRQARVPCHSCVLWRAAKGSSILRREAYLGRITFLSAALGRPGIFSDNSQLNKQLYPRSTVAMFDTVRLRELVRAMLLGLANGTTDERLLPSSSTAAGIGDFQANQARLRKIIDSALALGS